MRTIVCSKCSFEGVGKRCANCGETLVDGVITTVEIAPLSEPLNFRTSETRDVLRMNAITLQQTLRVYERK